ncbi:MAG: T9SS type A sorting domain-containing protein [Flavobacteriales bacterium]
MNKVIETNNSNQVTWAYLKTPDGLISYGATNYFNESPLFRNLEIKTYDSNYDVETLVRYGDTSSYYYPSWSICKVHNHYYGGGGKEIDDTLFASLIKFDSAGSVLWEKNYLTSYELAITDYVIAKDDKIYLSGRYINNPNGATDVFLIECDTSGAIQWQKFFGVFNNGDEVKGLNPTDDGGFILSTIRHIWGGNWITVVYKLDEDGNIQWTKNLGGGGERWQLSCSQLPDGGYFCRGFAMPVFHQDSWFVRLDGAGNVLNDTIISFSPLQDFASPSCNMQIVNNSIRVTGQHNDQFVTGALKSYYASFDMDGNFEWIRYFYRRTNENLLTTQIPLPNNFMLLAGFVFPNNNPPDGTTADEWIVIVDEHGCEVADCALSVLNPKGEDPQWEVFPNPTSEYFTLKTNVPLHRYELYTLQGQLVQQGSLTQNNSISVSKLPQGVYILTAFPFDSHKPLVSKLVKH